MKRLEWKQRSRPDEGECLCCKPYKILRELCFGVSFQVFPFNIIIVTFLQECLFSKNFSDTSLHVYWTGVLRLPAVTVVANAGISLSTVLNVQLPYQLMALCTWGNQRIKIFTALTILRATVTISTKERCTWVTNCAGYSGSYDAYTGWNSVSRIFIEEVPKPQA